MMYALYIWARKIRFLVFPSKVAIKKKGWWAAPPPLMAVAVKMAERNSRLMTI